MVGLTYNEEFLYFRPVPLTSVNVDVQNTDCLSTTSVTQIYINSEPKKINCSYAFNLDKDSVVTGFFITFSSNGRKMKGEIREKSEAVATYTSGVSRGKKSCLLQNFGNGSYNVEVGNVDPNETVVINYTYSGYISCTVDGYKYLFPTNIMDKYVAPTFDSKAVQNVVHASSPPYTFDLYIRWKSGTKITNVNHNMSIPVGVTNVSDNERIITISSEPRFGDLSITLVTEITPSLYVQTIGDDVYNMISTRIAKAPAKKTQIRDYVCVLDRSGSMGGDKIKSAQHALKLFIQSLPAECYFNVVTFGDEHTKLFTKSQRYTDTTKQQALDAVDTYMANMGGTEILSTLQSIGKTSFQKDVNERIIILLTDGGVTNESDVVSYVATLKNTRIFTIGIGCDVSRSLVERVASAGHGTCTCVIDVIGLNDTIMDVLELTSMQYYTNITSEYFSDVGKVPIVSSLADTEYVYPGSYFKLFNLLKADEMKKVKRVVVKGKLGGGDVSEWTIEPSTFVATDIDKFYAIKYITSASNVSTNEAVAICIKHSVLSQQVSMVMVDETSTSSADKAVDVVIPHHDEVSSSLQRQTATLRSAAESTFHYDIGAIASHSDNSQGGVRGVLAPFRAHDESYYADDCDSPPGNKIDKMRFASRSSVTMYSDLIPANRRVMTSADRSPSRKKPLFSGLSNLGMRIKSVFSKKTATPATPAFRNVPSVFRNVPTVTASVLPTDLLDFQRADGSFHICPELMSLLKIDEDTISRIMSKSHCTRNDAIYEIILETLSKESKYRLAHKKTLDYVTNVLRKSAPSSA
jgi:hypothetical protein